MKKNFFVAIYMLLSLFVSLKLCFAAAVYDYPEIEPNGYFWLGYNVVDNDGNAARVGRFYDLDSSVAFGGHYEAYPFPQRLYLETDFYSDNEWFGDIRYSFKDIFQFRIIPRRFFHNLDNVSVVDLDTSNAQPSVSRRDVGSEYGFKVDIDDYNLRLKTPDFPFHLFSKGRFVMRQGSKQQRFLGGSGYFNNISRVTQSRDVDEESREHTLGVNSHLGVIEVEVSHTERSFETNTSSDLYETFAAPPPAPGLREAGTYPHNSVPELKASTNTFMIHTSHTGRIFASSTFSQVNKENTASGAEAENNMGFGEIMWMPKASLLFAAKYRHQKNDAAAPSSVTVVDQTDPTNSYSATVHPGVKSKTDTAIAIMRYSVTPRMTLKTKYTRKEKEVEEESAVNWHQPAETTSDIFEIDMNWRTLNKIKLKARYILKDTRVIEGAAEMTNTEPEHVDRGILSLTWTPKHWMTALLRGDISKETADNFQILNPSTGTGIPGTNDYDSFNERYLGSVTFVLTPRVSLVGSYAYMATDTKQDIAYDTDSSPIVDEDYSHKLKTHNAALNVTYLPTDALTFQAIIDYVKGYGDYYPTSLDAVTPISIGDFAMTRVEEWILRLNGSYEFENGWGLKAGFRYLDLDDDSFDNPAQGKYMSTFLAFFKRW